MRAKRERCLVKGRQGRTTRSLPEAAQGPWSWKVGSRWDQVELFTPAHYQVIKVIQVNRSYESGVRHSESLSQSWASFLPEQGSGFRVPWKAASVSSKSL